MTKIESYLATNLNFTKGVVCYLVNDTKVILGLRKKVSLGLGENLISGIGGKVGDQPEFANETDDEALNREVFEEIGVKIQEYKKVGRVRFIFPHIPKWNQDVTAYLVSSWVGVPSETESIRPMEFDITNMPFEKMWDDNKYWVPSVLAGKTVDVVFLYDENSKVIEQQIF